ncbi:MAG: glycosyltransferase [Marinilabiliaceae bacterium]|nr:glycosyltransferase [Marinilabiliaceae bacterium]
MKVLCISAHGPVRAGKVAFDLHHNFIRSGYDSKMLTIYHEQEEDDVISMHSPKQWKRIQLWKKVDRKIFQKIKSKLGLLKKIKKDSKYQFFELDGTKQYYSTPKILHRLNGFVPDVIVVFFTTEFVTVKNIKELAQVTGATILWEFLDMAPITGGCHYAWECEGYHNGCGNCPALFSKKSKDHSSINLAFKKDNIQGYDLRLMIGSEWDHQNTSKSSLFKDLPIYRTFLGIDSNVFKPVDKVPVRSKWGIPEDRKVLFFGSVHFGEKRKGMSYLMNALNLLNLRLNGDGLKEKIILLIAGNTNDFPLELLPFKYHCLGYLKQVNELAAAYQAADVFVCPSVYDSGPVMVNQALMSGTPIVSFEMGVSLDLVHSGKTGYRAKLKDSDDLAEGLFRMVSLSLDNQKKMEQDCRSLALDLIDPEKVIHMYTSVFEEIKGNKMLS